MRLLLIAALMLVLIPIAQAQTPAAKLSAEGLSQKYIASGQTQLAPLTLVLEVTNLVCTTSVPFKVTLLAIPQPSQTANASGNHTFTAVASPNELTFTVPQGAYGSNAGLPAAQPFRGRQTATIAVGAQNLTNATSVEVGYEAEFAGYSGADCRGSGAVAAARDEGSFKVDFAPTMPGTSEPGPKMPLPSSLALLAIGAALLIMRRRAA